MRSPSPLLFNLFVIALAVATLFLGLVDFQTLNDYASMSHTTPTLFAPAVLANVPVGNGPVASTTFVASDMGNTVAITEDPGAELPPLISLTALATTSVANPHTLSRSDQQVSPRRAGEYTNHQPFLWIFACRMR